MPCYILVLCGVACGSDAKASSVNQIFKDLVLDEERGVVMCKEAVFRVKKNGEVDFGVSLHVPLTFPQCRKPFIDDNVLTGN